MNKEIQVSHFIGLSGIGGVQKNFSDYLAYAHRVCRPLIAHSVYTIGKVDDVYDLPILVRDVRKLRNLSLLVRDVVSKKHIVHFYNNLSSGKLFLLLLFLPVSKIILHERGSAWNQGYFKRYILRFVSWKADIVLTNSNATLTLLLKRFGIPKKKLKVIYNGINLVGLNGHRHKTNTPTSRLVLGYIGRFEFHKGVHILIDAMKHLSNVPVELVLAGDGPMNDYLRHQASYTNKINFVGRINDPLKFIEQIDILVVPSIREPFGNVCLEAGLMAKPVIAAAVDGLCEIIDDHQSGVLVQPTMDVDLSVPVKKMFLPDYVVSCRDGVLVKPKQIAPLILSRVIKDALMNSARYEEYGRSLQVRVETLFSSEIYCKKLHATYISML